MGSQNLSAPSPEDLGWRDRTGPSLNPRRDPSDRPSYAELAPGEERLFFAKAALDPVDGGEALSSSPAVDPRTEVFQARPLQRDRGALQLRAPVPEIVELFARHGIGLEPTYDEGELHGYRVTRPATRGYQVTVQTWKHPADEVVTTFSRGGMAGAICTSITFRWIDGKAVAVRRVTQDWIDDRQVLERTVYELEDGEVRSVESIDVSGEAGSC